MFFGETERISDRLKSGFVVSPTWRSPVVQVLRTLPVSYRVTLVIWESKVQSEVLL